MKITSHTGRGTTTHRVTTGDLARRAVTLSVAGALACLAIPPATAHADQVTAEGGGASSYARDIDDAVAVRKTQAARDYVELGAARSQSASQRQQQGTVLAHIVVGASRSGPAADATCYIPETLDRWSRRLIAVQFCGRAKIVPADFLTRVAYGEPVTGVVGHCGHHVLHQQGTASDRPVSAWYTPTSC
jgi:hypothetical protein